MIIKKATAADIDLLIELRMAYLEAENENISNADKDKIRPQIIKYFTEHIDNDFIAMIAYDNDRAVSTVFMVMSNKPANLSFINGITANILNVYTHPDYRRRGIATKVMNKLIDEAKKYEVSCIDLYATEQGKPLYEKLGFKNPKNTAMRLEL